MLRKHKYKFTRKKSVYDQYNKKFSYSDRLLLFGTTDVIKKGHDALDIKFTRSSLMMFYLYLEYKYKNEKNALRLCTFMHKFFFRSRCIKTSVKEYSLSEIRKNFIKYYDYYAKDMEDNTTLCTNICDAMKGGKIDYYFSFEHKTLILEHVEDYIDFLELYCISGMLSLDDPVEKMVARQRKKQFTKDPNTKSGKDDLRRRIESRTIEIKLTFFTNTINLVKKDLSLYLSDTKFKSIRTIVESAFIDYELELQSRLHFKFDHYSKVRTQKQFFNEMNKEGMNWVCNCTNGIMPEDFYFYVYVYDIVMYKFKLLTYLLNNEWKKKTQDEILSKLAGDNYEKNDKKFDFFSRNIQKSGDINAHIIKLFPESRQRFITNILAIETRTKYINKEVTPMFASIATLLDKSAPIESLKLFILPPSKKKSIL